MGIQGLLPFLANSTRDAHISEFENQYVAVDAYVWLHKGIYSCSYELAMKKPTTKYVTYCMRYIEMLRHFKVKPILVFDGRNLTSKEETEKKRREDRARKYKKGLELIRAGKTMEGRQLVGESVDVGHELVVNLIKECRKMNIDCIVAPYEADAQLAYFSIQKIVACIITEDSDLLAYGCERVMFKMDKSGRGKLIEKSNLCKSLGVEHDKFSEEKFRYMCILSGCDYLPSLPSIGPANALKFVKLICDKNILETLPQLPKYLNKLKITVSHEYIEKFKIADTTFKHQLVYDPFLRKQVPLRPVSNDSMVVGDKLLDNEAFQLAIGNIDPSTMKILDNFDPDKCRQGFDILWKTNLMPKTEGPLFNDTQNRSPMSVKRQSEVNLFRHNLKKHCAPKTVIENGVGQKNTSQKNSHRSGFIFENKTSEKPTENYNLLKSRYFIGKRKIQEKSKTMNSTDKGKLKDESYEEYLRRLYEEHILDDENEGTECVEKDRVSNYLAVNESDSSRNSDKSNLTQKLDSCLQVIQNTKKVKKDNAVKHSLLDEISKTEENDAIERIEMSLESEKSSQIPLLKKYSFTNDIPNLQSLCFDSSTESQSNLNEMPRDEIEENFTIDKTEVSEINIIPDRSPSPVFKIHKKTSILNECLEVKNFSDTISTPTSFYFSSFSGSFDNSRTTDVEEKTSIISPKTKHPVDRFRKKNKSIVKSLPSNRTLFQFGFKKEAEKEAV